MTSRASARYFVASIVLLVAVVGVYAFTTARRTQAELARQLEQQAFAIADAVNAASLNAVRSSALVERMITERLLDNARLVDALVARPVLPGTLRTLAEKNGLRRIDLLDVDGKPWTPPAPGFAMRALAEGDGERPMRPFMWGPRWRPMHDARADERPVPVIVEDRKFWDGTVFGVAIGATSFRGVIAVHADAGYVLNFRREVGVDRLLADIARQAGVASLSVVGDDLVVLADAEPSRIGRRTDAIVTDASRGVNGRFDVVRPLALDGTRRGYLVIGFSTEPMTRAWRSDIRAGGLLAGVALAVGGVGLGLIFWVQQRHLHDVRRLEAGIAQRERLAALGDVAAAFAHEVRNPLNAVSMGLQRLRAEFAPEPAAEYARFVTLMQGEVRRLNATVEQFLALARPLPLKRAAFPADGLLREVGDLVEGQARAGRVAVRVAVPAGLPDVTADRDHVKQVLLNLVLNAVQAMAETGGTVDLGAERARAATVLTVDDTGPGIPPEARGRIFDPYFTTKRAGLGLGLTIARRIAEAHGGTLHVTSPPGGGAHFRFTLPDPPP